MSVKKAKSGRKYDSLLIYLERSAAPKPMQNLLDYDYIDKLNNDEKRWLAQFTKEYYRSRFEKCKAKLTGDPKKDRGKFYSQNNLHQNLEQIKECYLRNRKYGGGKSSPELFAWVQAGGKLLSSDEAIHIYEKQQTEITGKRISTSTFNFQPFKLNSIDRVFLDTWGIAAHGGVS